jgi:2-polyprenyl-6-hydroxyphenyl methylase/3-demethylubiquinone-9 3-methyltransferase
MKSPEELRQLHGQSYVDQFEKQQSVNRLQRLVSHFDLNRSQRAADFACGNGMIMEYVAPRVKEYVGVDFSTEFIAAANQRKERLKITNAEFVCASIEDFCREQGPTFDVGFAMDFSEHVYDADWLQVLSSIRESLKDGGRLYLHTPNREFFLEIMKDHNFLAKQYVQHIAVRNAEQNVSLLEQAGFKIHRLQLLPHYNVLKYVHPLSYIPLVGKYFKARVFIEACK